jgi:tetratricopeptide (TPR) repeat protein
MRAYIRSRALGHNVHWTMAMLFRILSRNAESIAEFHEAAAIEPMVPQFKFQLYETYYCAGRYAEAISGLAEFFSGDDAFIYSNIVLAKSYAGSGDFDSALQLADKVAEEIGEEAPLAEVYVLAGQVERARRALDATDMMGEPFVITDMAPAVALLGNQDRALDMLERAADMVLPDVVLRYDWLWRWRCAPAIQGLSGNPRYEALLERLGLPE